MRTWNLNSIIPESKVRLAEMQPGRNTTVVAFSKICSQLSVSAWRCQCLQLREIIGNWPAIRVSVEQCFGGQHSSEKERWLQEVIFNVFMENESLDPLDIEDYLAEILSNEFNVIIEDGSLGKVSEKLCNYYDLCKKGQHLKVAEEINSISLPKMNVKYEENDMEVPVQEDRVAKELGDLSISENKEMKETEAEHGTSNTGVNGVNNSHDEVEQNDEGWVVVQRGRKKR